MAVTTATWKWVMMAGIVGATCGGITLPEDMEIIDGYDLGSQNIEQNGDEDGVYERKSLLEPRYYRSIEDRRDAGFNWLLWSTGLHSFRPSGMQSDLLPSAQKQRMKRNVELTDSSMASIHHEHPGASKSLPVAEQWTKTPYKSAEHQAKLKREESDSDAEASILINEGIKSRAPRVNFITQQTKSHESSAEKREGGNEQLTREMYRRPMERVYYEQPLLKRYDSSFATSASPMYPRVYDKYDAFHRDMMDRMHPPSPHRYDQYHQRRYDVDYDSYYPRYKFPYYYYYPDRRYDVPLFYRDRNYLYTNDIAASKPIIVPPYYAPTPQTTVVSSSVTPSMRNRRIIYYATLPEIVRTSPHVHLKHLPHLSNHNRFESGYTTRPPPGLSAYKNPRPVSPSNRKQDKYVSSKPIKIIREVDSQDRHQEQPTTLSDHFTQQRRWEDAKDSTRSNLRDVSSMLDSGRSFFVTRL